eukprot:c10845_g1_i4.p1 GENE.c10845_g1_i4~~c10845_g1_i4.p1  ORF type:complete len:628 (+),score=88.34 c10845_g1_i4:52-1935(+)
MFPTTCPTPSFSQTFNGHTKPIWSISFLPQLCFAVSGGEDGRICIWNPATPNYKPKITKVGRSLNCLCPVGDWGLAAAAEDGSLHIWEFPFTAAAPIDVEMRPKVVLTAHKSKVWSVVVCNYYHRLISADFEGKMCFWEINNKTISPEPCESVLQDKGEPEWCVTCLPSQPHLVVTGSGDRSLRVWDLSSNSCVRVLRGHTEKVWTVCSWSGDWVASAGRDQAIRIWDVVAGTCLRVMPNVHSNTITSLRFSVIDGLMFSASRDARVKVWRVGGQLEEGEVRDKVVVEHHSNCQPQIEECVFTTLRPSPGHERSFNSPQAHGRSQNQVDESIFVSARPRPSYDPNQREQYRPYHHNNQHQYYSQPHYQHCRHSEPAPELRHSSPLASARIHPYPQHPYSPARASSSYSSSFPSTSMIRPLGNIVPTMSSFVRVTEAEMQHEPHTNNQSFYDNSPLLCSALSAPLPDIDLRPWTAKIMLDTSVPLPVSDHDETKEWHQGVGSRLMETMGWQKGQGLGKRKQGITEPITTEFLMEAALAVAGALPQNGGIHRKDQQKTVVVDGIPASTKLVEIHHILKRAAYPNQIKRFDVTDTETWELRVTAVFDTPEAAQETSMRITQAASPQDLVR